MSVRRRARRACGGARGLGPRRQRLLVRPARRPRRVGHRGLGRHDLGHPGSHRSGRRPVEPGRRPGGPGRLTDVVRHRPRRPGDRRSVGRRPHLDLELRAPSTTTRPTRSRRARSTASACPPTCPHDPHHGRALEVPRLQRSPPRRAPRGRRAADQDAARPRSSRATPPSRRSSATSRSPWTASRSSARWSWLTDDVLEYRPQNYWPGNADDHGRRVAQGRQAHQEALGREEHLLVVPDHRRDDLLRRHADPHAARDQERQDDPHDPDHHRQGGLRDPLAASR